MQMEYAEITLADYDAVLELWQQTEHIGLSEADSRENVGAYLVRNPGLSLLVRHQGAVIAAVLCGHDGRRGYLHHLAVNPAFRQQGIGADLVARCLQRLGAVGIDKCNIFLFADNAAGQQFWTRRGWSQRSDLKVFSKPIEVRREP